MRTLIITVIFLSVGLWVHLFAAWAADVMPSPAPTPDSRSEIPERPSAPPPSRIDPGIERRPKTLPDPRSAVVPPDTDPKMTIDPESAPPSMEQKKPDVPPKAPNTPR